MPPKKKGAKRQRGGAAAAPAAAPAAPSLATLPQEVIELIGDHLLEQGKLNNIETSVYDLAALAQCSTALSVLVKEHLWPKLGGLYTAVEQRPINAVAKEEWYETVWMDSKCRKLEQVPKPKALAAEYEGEVPEEVPPHIYAEFRRLRCLATAGSNAKTEFCLTDADLKRLDGVKRDRGALGTAQLYRLSDLLAVARQKHGSAEGIQAAKQAKAQQAADRKRAKADKAGERRAALADAAGVELSDAMCQAEPVARYLQGGKAAPRLDALVPFVQLLAWAKQHAGWEGKRRSLLESESRFMGFKVAFRDEDDGSGYFGGGYDKAAKAAASLGPWEEEDLLRLACQEWAKGRGGVRRALARAEVPAEGPLRRAIEACCRQRMVTGVQHDVGFYRFDEDDYEEEIEEGGADGAEAGDPQAFFQAYTRFLQVEATGSSEAHMEAFVAWGQRKLRWLVRSSDSDTTLEAWPQPFVPVAGANAGGRLLLFLGAEPQEHPASLLDAAPYNLSAGGDEGASGSGSSLLQQEKATLERGLKQWGQRPEGLHVSIKEVSREELPEVQAVG